MKKLYIIILLAMINVFSASAMEVDSQKALVDEGLRDLFKIQQDQSKQSVGEYNVNEVDPISHEKFKKLIKEAAKNNINLIIAQGIQSIGQDENKQEFVRTYEAISLLRHLFGPNFISPKEHRANLSQEEQINFNKKDPINRQPLLGPIEFFSINNDDQTGVCIGSDLQLHANPNSKEAKEITDALLSTVSNEIVIDEYFKNAKELCGQAVASDNTNESNYLYRQAIEYFTILELKLHSLQSKKSILADIQFYLGFIYFDGLNDIERGVGYYQAAANQDDNLLAKANAQLKLGFIYFNGLGGLEQDIKQGLEYLNYAANQNAGLDAKANAQFNLGKIYFNGLGGLEQDIKQALEYLNYVASQDDNLSVKAEAQLNLGVIYFEGENDVGINIEQALKYLKAAASQDDNLFVKADAQLNLGVIYFEGLGGLDNDIETGLEYYQAAANQDDNLSAKAHAQFKLGVIYLGGLSGVEKNIEKGVGYYQAAANQNDNLFVKADAQLKLGVIYFDGFDY